MSDNEAALGLVREALHQLLLINHIDDVHLADIDDILSGYVLTLLTSEELREDAEPSETLIELLASHFPRTKQRLKVEQVHKWMIEVADQINNEGEKRNKESMSSLDLEKLLEATLSIKKEEQPLSTCSSTSSTSSMSPPSPLLAHLMDMFPYASSLEVSTCLAMAEYDADRATQLILQRHEQGIALKPTKSAVVSDKDVRDRIVGKYGFVSQEDDKKYHRPIIKKDESKKLIRYRDNKVVSTRGERFSHVSKHDDQQDHDTRRIMKI